MLGAMDPAEVTPEDVAIVKGVANQINCNCCNEIACGNFTVDKLWNQIVAGTMKWYHLTCCNSKYSVCVFVPLNGAPEVKITEEGHTPARNPNS